MNTKLYVGNIPYSATSEELEAFFSQAGAVVKAFIVNDKETRRSKGFGFVEMESGAGAQKALNDLHGKDFNGKTLVVREARPKAY